MDDACLASRQKNQRTLFRSSSLFELRSDHDSFQFENDLFESNLVKTAKVGQAMCMLLIPEICPKWQ